MSDKKIKLVVVGGGFAGIKAIRNLSKNKNIRITLITDQDTFRYGATIWRATTGYLKDNSYMPISSLLPQTENIGLIIDTVTKIDRQKKRVTTKSGEDYSYDYCIIGLGVVTSFFGIKGLEEYSYTVKSSEGFDKFREHLHNELLAEQSLDTNYVVVGAGPTGVELAAALKVYLKQVAHHHKLKKTHVNMDIVEAAPKVLPMLLPKASNAVLQRLKELNIRVMTGRTVKGQTATTLSVDDQTIPTRTVIWTAGVSNNPFFSDNADQFTLNDRKRVIVDENLRVDKHTFVIGDNAATKYSGLALTALHNASYVSKVIENDLIGEPTPPYKPLKPVTIIPIGESWAVFQWRKVVISGRIAAWMRSIYDFMGFAEVMGVRAAWRIWLRRNKKYEDCPKCKSQ